MKELGNGWIGHWVNEMNNNNYIHVSDCNWFNFRQLNSDLEACSASATEQTNTQPLRPMNV